MNKEVNFKKMSKLSKKIQKKIDRVFRGSIYKDSITVSMGLEYYPRSSGTGYQYNFEKDYNYKVVAVCPLGMCGNGFMCTKFNLNTDELLFSIILFDNVLLSSNMTLFLVKLSYDPIKYKNKFILLDIEKGWLTEESFYKMFVNPDETMPSYGY